MNSKSSSKCKYVVDVGGETYPNTDPDSKTHITSPRIFINPLSNAEAKEKSADNDVGDGEIPAHIDSPVCLVRHVGTETI